jgi:hypothetical protein
MSVTSTLMNCFIPRTLSDILPKWGVECNQPSALIIGPHVACSFVDHDGHDALSLGIVLFGWNCFHCLVLPPAEAASAARPPPQSSHLHGPGNGARQFALTISWTARRANIAKGSSR